VGLIQSRLRVRTAEAGPLNLVVDSPKGSRHKYRYQVAGDLWRLSRLLPLGTPFRFDFDPEPMLSSRGRRYVPLPP
jgi:inorganic pyrophosphatase